MSAVLPQRRHAGRLGAPARLWSAWRSVTQRELATFVLLGLSVGGTMVLEMADSRFDPTTPARFVAALADPLLCAALCLLAWLPADRSAAGAAHAGGRRARRLALAVLTGSALGALLVPVLFRLVGLPDYVAMMWDVKDKPPPPTVMRWMAESLYFAMPAAMTVAVIEMLGRRRRTEEQVRHALLEHATLARQALEARLAAMQAQVEPQFLFDVLVDIERLYEQSDTVAAVQLERLIGHLRVALPRLRESGSTLGAEVHLLASYLAVVQGTRHGTRQPALQYGAHVPVALHGASFHPMLLLPLVQRALRSADSTVSSVTLTASADPTRLHVALTLTGADLCRDDAEFGHVRERLHALYGAQAALDCTAADGPHPGSTFVMSLPR